MMFAQVVIGGGGLELTTLVTISFNLHILSQPTQAGFFPQNCQRVTME